MELWHKFILVIFSFYQCTTWPNAFTGRSGIHTGYPEMCGIPNWKMAYLGNPLNPQWKWPNFIKWCQIVATCATWKRMIWKMEKHMVANLPESQKLTNCAVGWGNTQQIPLNFYCVSKYSSQWQLTRNVSLQPIHFVLFVQAKTHPNVKKKKKNF